ncbi:MAG: hypothetical protein V3T84_07485 [Phycisphaerales bacterium]
MSAQQRQSGSVRICVGVVIGAIMSLAALVVALAVMHLDRTPSIEAGEANLLALWPFWVTSACVWAALTGMWMLLRRAPEAQPRGRFAMVAVFVLLIGVAVRIGVLLTHEPTLSDDVYRYVLDGRNLAHGINPYLTAPMERLGLDSDTIVERPLGVLMQEGRELVDGEAWPGERSLLPLINNPELHTLYLPTSQWVLAICGAIIGDTESSPVQSARLVRATMTLFDVAAICLILVVLRRCDRSAWWAALYAWHPLPITEIAGSGHQESIGVALLVLALLLFAATPRAVWQWTIALAIGALVKPVTVPLAALFLKGRSLRAWIGSAILGSVVCAALAAPLWLTHSGEPFSNLTKTAWRFSQKWAHFGSVYEPTLWALGEVDPIEDERIEWQKKERHELIARAIGLALVGAVIAAVFFSRLDVWASCRVVLLAMVLFSSTAHPWYLLWALVLVPRAPSPAVWIASLTLPWGYVQLGDVIDWTVPTWVMFAAYVPVYLVLIIDLWMRRRRGRESGSLKK